MPNQSSSMLANPMIDEDKNDGQLLKFAQKAMILAVQILGNRTEAEDVVQASLEKALSHPSAPNGGEDLQKWLYRVVRNAAIDRIRQQNRETSEQSVDLINGQGFEQNFEQISEQNPEQQLQHQQLKGQLNQALSLLSVEQREIVVLRDFHVCRYDEIAEILSIAEGTVMSRLHRARMALRQHFINLQQKD